MIEKIKELSKDTAIYGVSTIVGRFLGFLLVPYYTQVFTKTEFGVFSYIYAILAFMNILFIYGMDAAFMKYFSTADDKKKKITFSTAVIVVFITTTILSIILFSSNKSITSFLSLPVENVSIINLVISILFFDTISLIPFAYLRMVKKPKTFASIKIINIIINFSLNIILITGGYGIKAIFISNLCASAAAFLLLIIFVAGEFRFNFSSSEFRRMLKFGIFYLPAGITAVMVQMVDVPILRHLTDDSIVGLYRANYKLGIFMMLFVSMFQYAWQPFFLNNANKENAKAIFSKILTIFLTISAFFWIILSLFIDDVVKIQFFGRSLIGENYHSGVHIVPIILMAYIFHGMYVNFTAGIYIEEKSKYFPIVTGVGAILNVAANFTLIPIFGIMGAALATLISYISMAIGLYFYSQKYYRIEYEFSKVIIIITTIIITAICYYYLLEIDKLDFINKIIILAGFIISFIVFKVIDLKEIKKINQIIFNK